MKLSDHWKAKWTLFFSCSAALFFSIGINQFAQTRAQLPAPSGHVNDFAAVVDEKTRQQLEKTLENVKQRTGIEFVLATG